MIRVLLLAVNKDGVTNCVWKNIVFETKINERFLNLRWQVNNNELIPKKVLSAQSTECEYRK